MKLFKYRIVDGIDITIKGWTGNEPVAHIGDAGDWRYLSMPDGVEYDIDEVLDLQEVDVVADKPIIKTLFVYKEINEAVKARIRSRYDIDAELKALRTSDAAYLAFIEEAVAEGTARKQSLGLV